MAYTLSKKVAQKLGGQEHTNITIISFFSLTDKKSIYAISQTLFVLKNVKKLLLSSFPVSQREDILDNSMKDLKQGFCKVSYSAFITRLNTEQFHLRYSMEVTAKYIWDHIWAQNSGTKHVAWWVLLDCKKILQFLSHSTHFIMNWVVYIFE